MYLYSLKVLSILRYLHYIYIFSLSITMKYLKIVYRSKNTVKFSLIKGLVEVELQTVTADSICSILHFSFSYPYPTKWGRYNMFFITL
jgi:hypothetical protein